MEVLFLHGAGGWNDDQPIAEELRSWLKVPVSMPRLPDDEMTAEAWLAGLDAALEPLGPDTVIVGHSFGSSMALLRFAAIPPDPMPLGMVLLAAPFWGSEGWQGEYALPVGFTLPPGLPVFLHHCRDDGTVPIEHLDRYEALLPGAVVRRHDTGGHQFDGRINAVARDVAALGS
ncbi:alpha/beta fold hydrolase [Arthrobacter gandavensis]|uniref:alpha/beta fold hydrolase n=1 Tax=Arthrobacter gandavensis TaxID=169960 RepID=UPI00188FF4AC|nr:alpha/beta fold hydrolase [Arthrobacter gandavensis]MBF4994824.1 alpha/beta fold hydrolase [Arthrobacter gandavensis]